MESSHDTLLAILNLISGYCILFIYIYNVKTVNVKNTHVPWQDELCNIVILFTSKLARGTVIQSVRTLSSGCIGCPCYILYLFPVIVWSFHHFTDRSGEQIQELLLSAGGTRTAAMTILEWDLSSKHIETHCSPWCSHLLDNNCGVW